MINLVTVEGDLFNRCEMFDEADLDAALARFDELARRRRGWKTRQAKRTQRFWTYFAAPRLGRPGRVVGRRHLSPTIVVGS